MFDGPGRIVFLMMMKKNLQSARPAGEDEEILLVTAQVLTVRPYLSMTFADGGYDIYGW